MIFWRRGLGDEIHLEPGVHILWKKKIMSIHELERLDGVGVKVYGPSYLFSSTIWN